MTPLDNYPTVRAWIYNTFWVVGLGLAALQIWYPSVGETIPAWVHGSLQVYSFLGIGVGYTAFANMQK